MKSQTIRNSSLSLAYERNALRLAFSKRNYVAFFAVLAIAISVLYMYLLPSLPDGVLIAPYAINFITPLQEVFALVFGVLFGLVIVLNIYAFRMHASSGKRLTIGSVLASLVNGLCCTPIIPTLIALSGASTPILFDYSPRIQAFFEFNYPYFYLLSAALLLASVHYLSRNITSCCKR
ncbi:MAG TPA: hypothetical protein VFF30_07540 [Nitrososphaerales archaeon]|nr:hypothetical protein [Nitrososphaerales archaeon]